MKKVGNFVFFKDDFVGQDVHLMFVSEQQLKFVENKDLLVRIQFEDLWVRLMMLYSRKIILRFIHFTFNSGQHSS